MEPTLEQHYQDICRSVVGYYRVVAGAPILPPTEHCPRVFLLPSLGVLPLDLPVFRIVVPHSKPYGTGVRLSREHPSEQLVLVAAIE